MSGCFGCLGSIGGFVGLLFVLLALDVVFDSPLRVLLALVALFGLWLTWFCAAALVRRGASPRLTARPDVLQPGQTFTVACASTAPARLRLICRESTRRPAGNREVTDTHDWVIEEQASRQGELQFTIPSDAMHSFASRHHEILWLVEAQPPGQRGSGPGPAGRVELTVMPVPYSP
jgi:hypothetical protein